MPCRCIYIHTNPTYPSFYYFPRPCCPARLDESTAHLSNSQYCGKPQVPAAGADSDVEFASGNGPFLRRNIPNTEVTTTELESSSSRLARVKGKLDEAAQLTRWGVR